MARAALRPVAYDDRLSLVEHLDELRTRLIICLVAFLVCFAVCFWQNDAILEIINRPLEKTAFKAGKPRTRSSAPPTFQQQEKQFFQQAEAFSRVDRRPTRTSARRRGRAAEQFAPHRAGHRERRSRRSRPNVQ